VIREDKDRVLGSFELGALFFETADNREQFLIVDLVVTFDGGVFLREEGNRP